MSENGITVESENEIESELRYFENVDVPMMMTSGVNEELHQELVQCLVACAFKQSKELKSQGKVMDYFQLVEIESEQFMDEEWTRYKWTMRQDDGSEVTGRKVLQSDKRFIGKVYIIESWNGKTENVTPDDHYITVLLPEEY